MCASHRYYSIVSCTHKTLVKRVHIFSCCCSARVRLCSRDYPKRVYTFFVQCFFLNINIKLCPQNCQNVGRGISNPNNRWFNQPTARFDAVISVFARRMRRIGSSSGAGISSRRRVMPSPVHRCNNIIKHHPNAHKTALTSLCATEKQHFERESKIQTQHIMNVHSADNRTDISAMLSE